MQSNQQLIRTLRSANASLKDEIGELQAETKKLRQIIHALNTLQYNIDAITAKTDVLSLIGNILSAALEAVNSENGSLLLLSPRENQLVFVEILGQSREQLLGYRMPANQGIAGWILANNSPILIPDVRRDKRWFPEIDEATGFHTASLLGVPLYDDDRPLGVIEAVNTLTGEPFHEGDLDILILVARLASLALVRAEETTTD
ncbi:MAG: GAF domain-containing protein [Anaerolineales bacterium]|nr:GAF domain-containing protein [Anaerolineales bacterium]